MSREAVVVESLRTGLTKAHRGSFNITEPVDYLAFGPVFGTRTKQTGYDARGLDALREVVRLAAPRPLIAIGGIDAARAAQALAAGAAGVAVISAVAAADDPEAAIRELAALHAGPA